MTCRFLVLGLVVAGVVSVTPVAAQERLPIIDMHMHARTRMIRDAVGRSVPPPCNPRPTCESPPATAVEDHDVLRLTLEAMDRYNIVLGFLSDPLEQVYEWVAAVPERFIASPMIRDPEAIDLEGLRQAYEQDRLGGMGEFANQYVGIAASDERLQPFFALAHELDVPVLVHSGGGAGRSDAFRIAQGHPELLEQTLVRHPGLRLYLENASFPFLEETIALMYRYPNVYADVSTITWVSPRAVFYRYLRGLIDAELGDRLMFGSDQMFWPEVIGRAIEAIETADFLTSEQKRDIFYNNAARFLRLSDDEIARHYEQN